LGLFVQNTSFALFSPSDPLFSQDPFFFSLFVPLPGGIEGCPPPFFKSRPYRPGGWVFALSFPFPPVPSPFSRSPHPTRYVLCVHDPPFFAISEKTRARFLGSTLMLFTLLKLFCFLPFLVSRISFLLLFPCQGYGDWEPT